MDLLGSAVGLIILSPLLGGIALMILWRLGRPILFRQHRPGRDGRIFQMLKFRSMDDVRDSFGQLLADEDRISPFGAFLRRTSLDELPELWNVLRGDMSLVGPRPLLQEYLAHYDSRQSRRHEMRPGITGWAQVNGRNELSWTRKFELDVWYVENWSLTLDLRILAGTVGDVVRGRGVSHPGEATMTPFRGRSGETQPLVIVGAGGHGREVLDVVEAMNAVVPTFDFLGFLDDGQVENALITQRGCSIIGSTDRLKDLQAQYLIGVGSGSDRKRIDAIATAAGCIPATLVHPAATLGANVRLGPGCIITAGARLTTNIVLGRHVHVNTNATVAHDCVLGDYVTVSPGVNINGNVSIGVCAMLGTGSSVIQGVSIGAEAIVGAGAAVVRDLPGGVVAVGIPARPR